MRTKGIVAFLLSMVLIAGCSSLRIADDVRSISLVCTQSHVNADGSDHHYEDSATIKAFVKAIESAKKINGELDYDAEYELTLSYKSGKERKFYLGLTNRRDYNGLLVESTHSTKGYSIPKAKANRLRDIIYG